jgi:hypothetical protein
MAQRRSLHSVLQDGEVVQFKHGTDTYQSYFRSGLLISLDDPAKQYTSPTGFANDCSNSSVNGWLHCKVLREGKWLKLADLPQVAYTLQEEPPTIIASPKDAPTIRIKRMPPKAANTPKKALPPVHQFTIIANVLEPMEPAIEVTSVRRVKPLTVEGINYWLNGNKVYERQPSGAYVGRWTGSSIDADAHDSEEEEE